MQRGLGAGEFEPEEVRHDTELTLGPGMLLGIFFGLVVLCGLCFGLGYALGRRGTTTTAAATQPAAAGQAPTQTGDSSSKSSATVISAPQQRAVVDAPPSYAQVGNPAGSVPDAGAAVPNTSTQPQVSPVQPLVKPALPPQAGVAPPTSGLPVQPALSQASVLMVQVAAVSHAEDAEVLVGALRRRGYAVTARREPADGLIHVQVGPFNNRNDANVMCQRLLGDGYNASVRP